MKNIGRRLLTRFLVKDIWPGTIATKGPPGKPDLFNPKDRRLRWLARTVEQRLLGASRTPPAAGWRGAAPLRRNRARQGNGSASVGRWRWRGLG